uniref:Uncharacterized protein n=1 Tax=Clytia hemisphaerica TaxID=252671 RepID=A0A7M5XKN4_9CNID
DWLQDILPILEKTMEHISQSSNNTLTYSMLEDILHFFLNQLFCNKDRLFISCVMCDISISFNTDDFEKYFSIDYLLKTYSEFDVGKVLPQARKDFWKHLEIESLPELLPHTFSNLKFTQSEKIILKQFKFYVSKYIVDYMKRFKRRDWLQDLLPILEKTIEQISQASNVTRDFHIIFSMLEDLLRFFLSILPNKTRSDYVMQKLNDRFIDFTDVWEWFNKCYNLNNLTYLMTNL